MSLEIYGTLEGDLNETVPNGTGLFSLFPCSLTITGNLILIGFYAALLCFSAKLISDGAELLLDFGLPAGIIGGVVLPLLGAIPDSAMIVFSGIGGDRETANKQISVGMGTLAGSTIMLLTLPWLGSLILGRVDIINGVGQDDTRSKFTSKSFFSQGVTVFPDVTYGAIIMLITTLPYFVVQGADWHYGPARDVNTTVYSPSGQPPYIKYSSLVTFILAVFFLAAYLTFQVIYSVASKRKEDNRKEAMRAELMKRQVIKSFYLMSIKKPKKTIQSDVEDQSESKPLLNATETKKFAKVWKTHRAATAQPTNEGQTPSQDTSQDEEEEHNEDPKWKILLKSACFLFIGVVAVTFFSDPMVDALTSLSNRENKKLVSSNNHHGQHIPIPVFYLSFIVTPLCSNASELVSSLILASKKKVVTSSTTYSQLYGAATMNNTLCLAVFAALVYFRELDWQFSAEVSVILIIEFAVGILAIVVGFGFKHTYKLILGIFIGSLYFFAILLIALLENIAKWK